MLFINFIPLACAECDDSLPFSGASSIPLCYVLFPGTLLHQLFFHPLSPHVAIHFLVYLSILLFPNSYIIPFWEIHFLPLSVHAQINIIYLTFYFNVQGSVHHEYIPIYIQQDAMLHSLFISGNCSTCSTNYQEHTQLYLQQLVLVKPLLLPAAIMEEFELV